MIVRRLEGNPIIGPDMDGRMGANINGPSLLQVPHWVKDPLGKYYLYFAHHSGTYIRLAYADSLEGPWQTYEPGTLQLDQTGLTGHVASPDLHVDHERRRIVMFYHAAFRESRPAQVTQRAHSEDGIHFETDQRDLGKAYWRVFCWRERYFAIAKPGKLFRSIDGSLWGEFEEGPQIFPDEDRLRHLAVDVQDDTLWVYYSRIGDCPERILRSAVPLGPDWRNWTPSEPEEVLAPSHGWEGGELPLEASRGGQINVPVRQLRDPAIYREGERTYLLYSVAGERGIAVAEIFED